MADVTFETEFKDATSKATRAAANATRILSREIEGLARSDIKAAKAALALERANKNLASSAMAVNRAYKSGSRFDIAQSEKANRLARARVKILEAEANMIGRTKAVKGKPGGLGGFSGGLPAIIGGAAVLAGWMTVIDASVAAIGKGIELSIDFTKATASAAVFNEKTRMAFSLLRGDTELGSEAFDSARSLSDELGESIGTTTDRMKKLLAQQFSLGETEGLIRMVADLKSIGVEGEKSERVLTALTQIRSKGRLQAEEMLQLAEAGVSLELVYGALGKKLGKSRDELLKLQKAGKIGSDLALGAVQEAVLKKVGKGKAGEAGAEFADTTLQGAINRFEASKGLFLSDLADEAMPSFLKLSPIVRNVTKELSNPALRGKLGKTFETLGDLLDRQGPRFGADFANGLNVAADAFDRIVKLGSAFTEGFMEGFRPFLDTLGNDGVASVDGLTNSTQIFGTVAGDTLGKLLENLNSLIATLDTVGTYADKLRNLFGGDDNKLADTGRAVGASFTAGLQSSMLQALPGVGQAAAMLGVAMEAGTRGAIDSNSPSRKAMQISSDYEAGLALGARGDVTARAGAKLGASLNAGAMLGARQGVFAGSPAHRAITNNQTSNRNNVQLSQSNTFNGMGGAEATAVAKASLWDLQAIAKASFEVG